MDRDKPWLDHRHVLDGQRIRATSADLPHEDKMAALVANLIIRNMVASAKDKL